ncbi:MAG TPA: AI-2E family transporter [Candidatus Dormibacteraeota bacterium]|nr:AI-2E family transporter [Candidatus Dormibacteraeota bacterium]
MIQRRRVEDLWRSRDFRALVFLAVLAILTLVLLVAIRGILGPFILAIVLAFVLDPAVNAAQRRRVPRAVSVLVLYGVIAALLTAGVLYLIPLVREEFTALITQGPAIASYLQDKVEQHHVVSVLGVPIDLRQAYADSVRNLPSLLAGQLQSVVQNVFILVNWIFQALLVLLIAFFLVKDAHVIRRFFAELVPRGYRTDAHQVAADISSMLAAYMRGQLAICLLVGLVTGIAMWVAGIPYSLALGIVAGVTASIPFIGPILGALPAIAIAAFVTQSTGKVILVIAIYFVVSNVIYNFVSPKVFGDAVSLSPMLIIIAFVIGGYLGGILGLFIAVPVAATLRILFLYAHQRVYS